MQIRHITTATATATATNNQQQATRTNQQRGERRAASSVHDAHRHTSTCSRTNAHDAECRGSRMAGRGWRMAVQVQWQMAVACSSNHQWYMAYGMPVVVAMPLLRLSASASTEYGVRRSRCCHCCAPSCTASPRPTAVGLPLFPLGSQVRIERRRNDNARGPDMLLVNEVAICC
jgi:hypothetical protein